MPVWFVLDHFVRRKTDLLFKEVCYKYMHGQTASRRHANSPTQTSIRTRGLLVGCESMNAFLITSALPFFMVLTIQL